jgi:hypothetical protein
MLSNLLPGFRDVRTPLATGYLYLAAAWIWFGSNWVTQADDNRALNRLEDMVEQAGPAGVTVAVGFLAYLAGSVLVVRDTRWLRILATLPEAVLHWLYKHNKKFHSLVRERLWPSGLARKLKLEAFISDLDRNRQPFVWDDSRLEGWIRDQVSELRKRGWHAVAIMQSQLVPESVTRWTSDIYEHQGIGDDPRGEMLRHLDEAGRAEQALVGALRQVLEAEREALIVRMQIERETLFDSYDRVVAEAELRTSIFLPLSAGILGMAAFWNAWFLVLLVAPWLLARRGLKLVREADERVTQALTTGVMQSPTIQALLELPPQAPEVQQVES